MKYIKQLAVILAVSFIGELLNLILPLPVPASVYGIIIMFLCLMTGVIKLSMVEETADFLVSIMPLMFIEPTTSIMTVIFDVKESIAAIFVISIVSTIVVTGVTGVVAECIMKHRAGKEKTNDKS